MLVELLSSHLSNYFELLPLLELHYSLLYLVIARLLIILSALPNSPANLIESADDILSYPQLQLIDILIINIFNSISNEILIDAFTQHGASFKYEPHLLLSQKISS
jgi:hypothetical protein